MFRIVRCTGLFFDFSRLSPRGLDPAFSELSVYIYIYIYVLSRRRRPLSVRPAVRPVVAVRALFVRPVVRPVVAVRALSVRPVVRPRRYYIYNVA